MSLLAADRLLWLMVALPVIGFYILKPRLRRRKVSTLLFWDQIFEEKRQRSLWQNLRHWLSLLCQLLFVGSLVFALLDPVFGSLMDDGRELVLIVDNSASMQALDPSSKTSRLEVAKRKAEELIKALRPGDKAAVLTCGCDTQVSSGMTDFIPSLRAAVDAIESTDGPAEMDRAIETARRLSPDDERRQIVIVSDACDLKPKKESGSAADKEILPGKSDVLSSVTATPDDELQQDQSENRNDIFWVPVGSNVNNVGITVFQARRSTVDPLGYSLLVEVCNFSEQEVSCRFKLTLENSLVDVIPLKLEVDEVWTKTIQSTSETGGILKGVIDFEDALRVDNFAQAVVPRRPRVSVTLVKPVDQDAYYLNSVLSAIPLLDVTTITLDDYEASMSQTEQPSTPSMGDQNPGSVTNSLTSIEDLETDSTTSASVSTGSEASDSVGPTNDPVSSEDVNSSSLIVFSGVVPKKLPKGPTLFVGPPGDGPTLPGSENSPGSANSKAWTLGATVQTPLIAKQESESALLRHVQLENVLLDVGRDIQVEGDWGQATELLKTADDSVLMTSVERPEGRVVILSTDLDAGDLPLRIAFPVMMTNSIHWFLRQSNEIQPSLQTGLAASIPWVKNELDSKSDQVTLVSIDGAESPVQIVDRHLMIAPQRKTGVYGAFKRGIQEAKQRINHSLESAAETESDSVANLEKRVQENQSTSLLLAVNLCHAMESNLRVAEIPSQAQKMIPASGYPLWFLVSLFSTGFIIVEWALYHRRVIA